MKGMLRILEAIIGCVLLLTALSFFFGMKTTTVYWDESKIRMEIRDVLMSMYASGKLQQMIDNNEINNIQSTLEKIMPTNTDFSVELNGLPPRDIKIACLCSAGDADKFQDRLRDMNSNGINYGVTLRTITNIDQTNTDDNVLIVSNRPPTQLDENNLNNILGNGTGVIYYNKLTENDINNYPVLRNIFNLTSQTKESGDSSFSNIDTPGYPAFRISEYFNNTVVYIADLGNFYVYSGKTTVYICGGGAYMRFDVNCGDLGSNYFAGDVLQINGYYVKIYSINSIHVGLGVIDHGISFYNYFFTAQSAVVSGWGSVSEKNNAALIHANYYKNGRTVWINSFYRDINVDSDYSQLLRGITLWATGEKIRITQEEKDKPGDWSTINLLMSGTSYSHPVELKLIFWKVFF